LAGLPDGKIARVVGLSSSVLFDKQDPQNPINRRISIVIMTKQAEEDALKTDVANTTPAGSGAPIRTDPAAPGGATPQAGGTEPIRTASSPSG
jgi:chemotaxis protein MotB